MRPFALCGVLYIGGKCLFGKHTVEQNRRLVLVYGVDTFGNMVPVGGAPVLTSVRPFRR